jgi:DNA-binding CsgD family transcriptional regulator
MSVHPHTVDRPVLAPHLQQTIEALADGETMREMAARFYISPNSVKSRLKTLYQLLGARDQAHAVAIAFRLGMLDGNRLLQIGDLARLCLGQSPRDALITLERIAEITETGMPRS